MAEEVCNLNRWDKCALPINALETALELRQLDTVAFFLRSREGGEAKGRERGGKGEREGRQRGERGEVKGGERGEAKGRERGGKGEREGRQRGERGEAKGRERGEAKGRERGEAKERERGGKGERERGGKGERERWTGNILILVFELSGRHSETPPPLPPEFSKLCLCL